MVKIKALNWVGMALVCVSLLCIVRVAEFAGIIDENTKGDSAGYIAVGIVAVAAVVFLLLKNFNVTSAFVMIGASILIENIEPGFLLSTAIAVAGGIVGCLMVVTAKKMEAEANAKAELAEEARIHTELTTTILRD